MTKSTNFEKQILIDTDLLSFNRQGLIPGPDETEDEFLCRVQTCLELKLLLEKEGDHSLPFKAEIYGTSEIFEKANLVTEDLFDINPSWLPVFFSNYQLTPWHGGCAWIFQLLDNDPKTAFLQLRKVFAYREKFLKYYSRDELIAHECAHVGRMMFEEERFEELLAYRTSKSKLSRWLGPIIQSARESLLFMGTLCALFLLDLYLILSENHEIYLWAMWLKIVPLGLFLFTLGRLWQRHRTFNMCLQNLKSVAGIGKANHIIYRLKDEEIALFAKSSSNEIIAYAKNQSSLSLRWRLINLAYF